jgi:serine protease Do
MKEPIAAKWNDDPVREGMTVVAIGHPLGYEFTVTKGIVSTSKRVLQNVEYIQTDVPINPGNSGGPLIDEEGEILGINTWMRSDAQNIGFAIPIRYVLDALKEIEPLLDKLEETEYCNVCGFLNPDKPKYCAHCGVVMHRPEVKPPEKPQPPVRPSHKAGTDKEDKAKTEQENNTAESEEKTEPEKETGTKDGAAQKAEADGDAKAASDNQFCIHCGAQNPAVAKFCKKCGKPMT